MKKRICIFLLGLILGIIGFMSYENINIIFVAIFCLIMTGFFIYKDSDFFILFIALFLGFFLASFRINSYNMAESLNQKAYVLVLDKREGTKSPRYTMRIKNKNYDERVFVFSDYPYEIGDEFVSNIDIKLINKNTNPNLFNYRNYALSKNVTMQVKILDENKDLKINKSNSIFLSLRRKFKAYVTNTFSKNLSKDASDFVRSLVLAENLIDREFINKLGLAHILAVSGLHLDLLIGFVVFILKRMKISYKYALITALVLLTIYASMIGFAFSIQRVLFVNIIGLLGFLFRKPVDKVKSLALAALIILLINPYAILNAGFILSFMASLTVTEIYPRFKKLFREGFIRDSFAYTASIQLACMPFTVYYFRYFNLLSILANFLIVPVFEVSIYLIFGLLFLNWIFGSVLFLGFLILDILINSILNMTYFLSSIDILYIEFIAEPIIVSIYLFVLIYIFAKIKNKKHLEKFIIANLLVMGIFFFIESKDKPVEYQMIDIGQGDAFLLKDKGKYYMVDVGGPKYKDYDSGEQILIPYLKSLGIREFEAVFISHEDTDHYGNLKILSDNFKIKNIITDDKVSDVFKKTYQPKIMEVGNSVSLSNGKITCIYSGTDGATDKNDQSLGLIIEIANKKILTLGDLSSDFEDKLNVRADVLKLSHHGSSSSSSKAFIDQVNPKIALISAGRYNTYGHPDKKVLENINNIKTYNTQTDGLVTITFENNDIQVEKYLKEGFFR